MTGSFIKFFNKIFKKLQKIPKLFMKMPMIQKLLILLIIAFIVSTFAFNKREGFEQASDFIVKKTTEFFNQ